MIECAGKPGEIRLADDAAALAADPGRIERAYLGESAAAPG